MLHILVCLMKQTWLCPTWERIADAALIFLVCSSYVYRNIKKKYVKSHMTTNTKEKKKELNIISPQITLNYTLQCRFRSFLKFVSVKLTSEVVMQACAREKRSAAAA